MLYNCYSIATNCNPIHDLSSNSHAKIATQLNRIISITVHSYELCNNCNIVTNEY